MCERVSDDSQTERKRNRLKNFVIYDGFEFNKDIVVGKMATNAKVNRSSDIVNTPLHVPIIQIVHTHTHS